MLTEGFFAMTQQLLGTFSLGQYLGILSSSITWYYHSFYHYYFVTVAGTFSVFFSVPDLAVEYFLLYKTFLKYIAFWEDLPNSSDQDRVSATVGLEIVLFNIATSIHFLSFRFLLCSQLALSPTILQDVLENLCQHIHF